jgi:hypothetical protein
MHTITIRLRTLSFAFVLGFLFIAPQLTHAAAPPCKLVLTTITQEQFKNYNSHNTPVPGQSPAPDDCNNVPFSLYFSTVLSSLFPYVLFIAFIMIVFSGIQYMTSGLSADNTKAAKQRIIGILSGVILFFLIRLIINQITPGLSI